MAQHQFKTRLLGFIAAAAMAAGAVQAQTPQGVPNTGGMSEHIHVEATVTQEPPPTPVQIAPVEVRAAPPPRPACCSVAAGTPVAIELVDPIGTREVKTGDLFHLRLAAPLIVDGQVVLPAGTPAVGRVVQATKPAMGGKGAKLVVSAEYLKTDTGDIRLQGLKLAANGKDDSMTATVLGLGGIAFAPLSIIGFAIQGGDIEIPAGTAARAKIAEPLTLAAMGPASTQQMASASALLDSQPRTNGWLEAPRPPAGMGQVVFFRPKTVMGTGQWFNVREDGEALGKLTNGAYFVKALPPGEHHFTASTEPELKDQLILKVDAGETYYVEGGLTKGLIIGAANLTPSDKAKFDLASGDLKPADTQAEASPGPVNAPTASR
jgi:hypothetical protein